MTRVPEPGDVVRVNLFEHPKLGSGNRWLLVLERRQKLATVFYEPELYQFDITLEELDSGAVELFNRRAKAARIRAKVDEIKRRNREASRYAKARSRLEGKTYTPRLVGYSKAGVEKALEVLTNA